jgi:transposase-like protein
MVTGIIDATASSVQPFSSTAAGLTAAARETLAIQVLARTKPVSELARRHQVSRPFLYRQAQAASEALQARFDPSPSDPAVLFYLPVTRDWLHQFVLALVLEGHASFRGLLAIAQSLFDDDGLSLGSLHTILQEAVALARGINQAEDLSAIRVGVHDEIFQARKPVLVGVDARSTYCYLLAAEDHRDETTWGTHLLDLERRGFHPDYTIADGGVGLRAGQNAACPDVACHGDVFHAERDLGQLATYLENRALGAIAARQKAQAGFERALRPHSRRRRDRPALQRRLEAARQAETDATDLADDLGTLADWMRRDVLALAGPDPETRRRLFDFIVEELRRRQPACPHRIGPVCRMLEGQRDHLLAFADVLEERFEELAARFQVPRFLIQAVAESQGLDPGAPAFWQRQARLHQQLRGRLHEVAAAVRQVFAETPRASSLVENLNSRLRQYFFLRRQIGEEYLELLRFFLNHRRFPRSQRPERVGRSPAELLTGRPHEHWLELLGHRRFHRN